MHPFCYVAWVACLMLHHKVVVDNVPSADLTDADTPVRVLRTHMRLERRALLRR